MCACARLRPSIHSDWLSGTTVGVATGLQEVQTETNILAAGAHGVYTRPSLYPSAAAAFLSCPLSRVGSSFKHKQK